MPPKDSSRAIDRRSFLRYLGGGALTTSGAVAVGTTTVAALHDRYGTVVDVVDEGAANDGSESVSSVLQDLVDNDTLLEFPPGRYYMDEQVRLTDFWNLGLVGYDATLVPADYFDFQGPQYRLFRLGTHYAPGNALRIDSFTVDQTAVHTGIRAFEAQVADDLVVEYVNVVGRHDSGTWGPGLFTVTDPGGSGVVRSFRARGGAQPNDRAPGDVPIGPTGILCNDAHAGTIRFENCRLGGFPDNGLYASGGSGRVIVDGGQYENSGTASIRLGGSGGEIRGTRVVVDENLFGIPQEAIRLDYGNWFVLDGVTLSIPAPNGEAIHVQDDVGGATVRNSSMIMDAPAYVGVQIDPGAGPTYLENVDLEMNDSNNAVLAEGDDPGEVGLVDVRVTGNAEGHMMRHAIRCERDDCYFRNVTVEQHGGDDRRGLALLGRDYFVYDCRVETSHRPVTVEGDDVWIQSCALLPDADVDSIRLHDGADGVRLKNNVLPGGVSDWGAIDVLETGTEY